MREAVGAGGGAPGMGGGEWRGSTGPGPEPLPNEGMKHLLKENYFLNIISVLHEVVLLILFYVPGLKCNANKQ